MNVGFGVGLIIVLVVGGVSYWDTRQVADAAGQRRHSYEVRGRLDALFTHLLDAETGQRGYLLTGRTPYLQPYETGSAAVAQDFRDLVDFIGADSAQQTWVRLLDPLIHRKLSELDRTVALRRRGGLRAALLAVDTDEGEGLMDSIRVVSAGMHAAETALTDARDARVDATNRLARLAILTGSLLTIGFLGIGALLINWESAQLARAAVALRDSESRLFQMLEALPVAVFVVDHSGRPYYANLASLDILGRGVVPDAAPGQLAEVYHAHVIGTGELYPTDRVPVVRALAGERVHITDLEIHRPDRVVPLEVWATPVYDAAGRVAYAIAAFSDITERRQAEATIERARQAAEAANRAKSDFLARMSHELRTPLNSIIGFSEVLEEGTYGALNDKQRRYASNVATSGRALLQLINDILDLSKVEAGRVELVIAEFDVAAALEEARTITARLAEQKHQTLSLTVESSVSRLSADEAKVKQILYNLIGNAIKFTPDGGRIDVTARRVQAAQGDAIEIAVADTGIGLRPEDRERIFGEFEQVDSPYGREQLGTGLGLALSRKLVELHGGRIWVESEVGGGSVFRFTLPERPRRLVSPRAMPAASDRLSPPGTGALVLVVEDDDAAADLLDLYLKQAGYTVARAATGEHALEIARTLKPSAITLDILLPGRDGLAILAQLKADPETRPIPVFIVSVTEDRELGFSLGALDWFVKPARRDDLIAAVRRAIRVAPASGSPTVLVVDDDPATVQLLSDILATQGFHVLAAHDGRQGIALAHTGRPDVIVLDLLMPEVTGLDVVQELRATPQCRDIPILIFTAKDMTAEEQNLLRGSVQGIVAKQGPGDLLQDLARVMSAPLTEAASGRPRPAPTRDPAPPSPPPRPRN